MKIFAVIEQEKAEMVEMRLGHVVNIPKKELWVECNLHPKTFGLFPQNPYDKQAKEFNLFPFTERVVVQI